MNSIQNATPTAVALTLLGNQCGSNVYLNEQGHEVVLYVFPLHCAQVIVLAAYAHGANGTEWDIKYVASTSEGENVYEHIKPIVAELNLTPKH